MKRMNKVAAVLLALVMMLLLAACGGGGEDEITSYPEITAVDVNTINLETAQGDGFSFSYPYDTWTLDGSMTPITVYLDETLGTTEQANLNVQALGEWSQPLDEDLLDELVGELENNVFYAVGLAELRTLNGESVIYIESEMSYTDESIDLALEQGAITQEMIDSVGGRDALKAIPPVPQMSIYAVADGNMTITVGSYFDDAQKQTVLDAMTVCIQTLEI